LSRCPPSASSTGVCPTLAQVRRHLKLRHLARRETFIPLDHPPGHRAEADFKHIHVDCPDGRRQVPVLVVIWSYSNCPFALALPTERTEAVLRGPAEAFAFFGCVPCELWWDNPTTVAVHVLRGRERLLHPRYPACLPDESLGDFAAPFQRCLFAYCVDHQPLT
jgi:transposase